jgi:hypothetical protein
LLKRGVELRRQERKEKVKKVDAERVCDYNVLVGCFLAEMRGPLFPAEGLEGLCMELEKRTDVPSLSDEYAYAEHDEESCCTAPSVGRVWC